ncbi:MAG: polysaccharide deacetylase family protein [Candidatus Humimicrobiaceae bacterium]
MKKYAAIIIAILFSLIPFMLPGCINKPQENINDSTQTSETVTVSVQESELESSTTASTILQEQQTIETSLDASTVVEAGTDNQETKRIALTFDAGWEYANTETLLNLLDEYNVKSTFFARGLWVRDHPDLAMEIIRRGHTLENHSLTHDHIITKSDLEVQNEIRGATDIIRETTGYLPQLFRPPFGEYDDRLLRILKSEGYHYTIMWTVDSHDWAEELNGVSITKEYVVDRVLGNASDNGIVLMHVGGYETINALPEIISGLKSQGYDLVRVNDML